jgi:tetratricopeptide (TPR) repeat protein
VKTPPPTYSLWAIGLFAILLVFATGYQALQHDYNLDDAYVMRWDYGSREKPALEQLKEIWTTRYNSGLEGELSTYGYRPIAASTYVLERAVLGKENTMVSHSVNLILYALCGFALYCFIRVCLSEINQRIALLAMTIFLLHPLHVEVSNSLKNREELLGFILSLTAIISYIILILNDRSILAHTLLFVLIILATLCKESYASGLGIAWIANLRVYFYNNFNKYPRDSGTAKTAMLGLTSFLIVMVLIFVWTGPFLPSESAQTSFAENPFAYSGIQNRIPEIAATLQWYIGKFLWPAQLAFYYGFDMVATPEWNSPGLILGIGIFTALLIALIYGIYLKKWYNYTFILLWFLVVYALMSNAVFTVNGIVADRYFFAPSAAMSIGLALLFNSTVVKAMSAFGHKAQLNKDNKLYLVIIFNTIPKLVIGTWLIALGLLSIQRSTAWRNRITLFETDAPTVIRSAHANVMLGNMYAKLLSEKVKDNANSISTDLLKNKSEQHFNRSLVVDSTYGEAYFGLGKLQYLYLNQPIPALENLRRALMYTDPTPHRYWVAAGKAYATVGMEDSAFICWSHAMAQRPETWLVDEVLQLLYDHEQLLEAVEWSKRAIDWLPDYYLPYLFLGDYYLLENRDTAQALPYLKAAVSRGYTDPKLIRLINKIDN